jgi:hypothetical protein
MTSIENMIAVDAGGVLAKQLLFQVGSCFAWLVMDWKSAKLSSWGLLCQCGVMALALTEAERNGSGELGVNPSCQL